MTNKEKIAYGKVYSKFNARIERYAYSFFLKTLKKQVANLKQLIDFYPIEALAYNIDREITVEAFVEGFNEFYPKAGKAFLKFHAAQFKLSFQKDKDPIQSINIAFRDAEKIAELAKIAASPEVSDRITKITDYTRKTIKDTIERGIAANLTKPQIAKEITARTNGAIAKNRALLIARTETTFISSKAAEINVQDSPFKLQKTWIPVSDMRTRPDHLEMLSKKPIPKDEAFNVGGVQMKYPGDPAGGAANCCNCRCAIYYSPIPNQSFVDSSNFDLLNGIVSSNAISQILNDLFSQTN